MVCGCGHSCGDQAPYMSYVGDARGEYIEETTYKYVGQGQGDFDMAPEEPPRQVPRRGPNKCVLYTGLMSSLVMFGIALLVFMGPGDPPVTTTPQAESGDSFECKEEEEDEWEEDEVDYCCKATGRGSTQRCSSTLAASTTVVSAQTTLQPAPLQTSPRLTAAVSAPPLTAPSVVVPPATMPATLPSPTFLPPQSMSLAAPQQLRQQRPQQQQWEQPQSQQLQPQQLQLQQPIKFDCNENAASWASKWTDAKKAFCCPSLNSPCHAAAPVQSAPAQPAAPKLLPAAPLPGVATSYNCKDELEQWQVAWPPAKKTWCCHYLGKGCPPGAPVAPRLAAPGVPAAAGVAPPPLPIVLPGMGVSPVTPPIGGAQNLDVSAFEPPQPHFDCKDGAATWTTSWVEAKKRWCCKEVGLGCQASGGVNMYDCAAGFQNWQNGWSEAKKLWCCDRQGKGCSVGQAGLA